jgi:hypothetical protein
MKWRNVINQDSLPRSSRICATLSIKAGKSFSPSLTSIGNQCDSSCFFGSMADFQPMAAGILEKDRIVARTFVIPTAFDISSARSDDELSHLARTVGPEGDPAFVGYMPR